MLILAAIWLAKAGQVDVPTTNQVTSMLARGDKNEIVGPLVRFAIARPLWPKTAEVLKFLEDSSNPAAIQYVIERMRDQKLDARGREEAYFSLARTGSRAGLTAILQSQRRPGPLPSLESRMDLPHLNQAGCPSKLLRRYKDAFGRSWGLIASDVMARKLTDTDQVIAAAYEAAFHFSTRSTVMVIDNVDDKIKPFPLPPQLGPAIWVSIKSGREVTDILKCDGRGIDRFCIYGGVTLNSDHREATMKVSVTMGGGCPWGCDYKLRKYGSRWFVVGKFNGWIA